MSEMLLTAYDGAILGPIAKLLGWVMNGVYYLMDQIGIGNVGLSIIIFTIIIYLLLFPLTYKQQKFSKLSQKMQPELRMVGSYSCEQGMEDAAIVNEINSHTPDMILLNLPVGLQEGWIMEHSSLLNARLCIAIGGVAELIFAMQKETPEWVRKLHLEALYHRIFREQAVKKDFRTRIFRKKITKYNNQNEIHDYTKDDSR